MKKSILIAAFMAAALLALSYMAIEPFGTSPGTMVQLSTSHVPTDEDVYFYRFLYPKMVRRDLANMTGDDPGELGPWAFPWYGRGMVPFG